MPAPHAGQVTAAGSRTRSTSPTAQGASSAPAVNASAEPATQRDPYSSAARPTASRAGPEPSSMITAPAASGSEVSARRRLAVRRGALPTRAPRATSQMGNEEAP
jgi:hypothetical protein